MSDSECATAEVDRAEVRRIVARHAGARGALIAVLEDVQARCGYLPEAALRAVAEQMGVSLVDVYGVATFYRGFSLQPRGRHLVSCCLGTACHVRGAPMVVEEFARQLGIEPGETTADGEFSLETVNCLGACALGPVVVADGHYFSKMRKSRVREVLDEALGGFAGAAAGADSGRFALQVSCPRCNHSLMDEGAPLEGRPSIRVTASLDGAHGRLWLSSLVGSSAAEAEPPVPDGAVLRLFCPHCHGELAGRWECGACGAPMVPLLVRGGGIVQVCSRRGCGGRQLDLV